MGDGHAVGEGEAMPSGESSSAHLVASILFDEGGGVDHVANRFGHLLAVGRPPAVRKEALRQRQAGSHQEGGPVDGVKTEDVLMTWGGVRTCEKA